MMKLITSIGVLCSLFIVSSSFFQKKDLKESIKMGKEVYKAYCMNCHMEDGKGTPGINPPLANADYIKNPVKSLIKIIIEGQSGEITVNKKKYNSFMPPQYYLTDEQVADVMNYIRNTWGNKVAGTVTPAQVKALRK